MKANRNKIKQNYYNVKLKIKQNKTPTKNELNQENVKLN